MESLDHLCSEEIHQVKKDVKKKYYSSDPFSIRITLPIWPCVRLKYR